MTGGPESGISGADFSAPGDKMGVWGKNPLKMTSFLGSRHKMGFPGTQKTGFLHKIRGFSKNAARRVRQTQFPLENGTKSEVGGGVP